MCFKSNHLSICRMLAQGKGCVCVFSALSILYCVVVGLVFKCLSGGIENIRAASLDLKLRRKLGDATRQ